jgi:hypothetical protein
MDPNKIKVASRFWVRITGTNVGIAVEIDPALSQEKNVQKVLVEAKRILSLNGLAACSKLLNDDLVVAQINLNGE